jgi:hypothetical protein
MYSRTSDELINMLPGEYEEWRERGDDFRRALSHAVMRHLATPESWQVNAEYRAEFGGMFPVQCRYTPPGGEWHVCVCSPGEVSPAWMAVLVTDDGHAARVLMTSDVFNPESVNALLRQTAALARMRCSFTSMALMLTQEAVA